MRKAVLTAALASLAMWAQAAPPPETVATRIETVSPASRKFVADGLTWALSSTAAVREEIASSTAVGSTSSVSGRTSTKRGNAPRVRNAATGGAKGRFERSLYFLKR